MKLGSLEVDSPYLLAPMAGYTDKPFRYICKRYKAGLTVSELISVNAIYYKNTKTDELMQKSDIEKPFSIQLFGADPDIFLYAAQVVEHRCDCIDINAGCPVSKVVKAFAGSYLLKDKKRLFAIIDKLKKHIKKPVSIKLRKGFDSYSMNDIAFYKELQERGIDFIVIHPRLRSQFFKGEIDYEHVAAVKEALRIDVVVNGGIDSVEKLEKIKNITGDGFFMVGQAAIEKPYIFEDLLIGKDTKRDLTFIKNLIREHFLLMVEHYGEKAAVKNFRKFFHRYIKGINNAKVFKSMMNECSDSKCVIELINNLTNA